MVRIIEVKVYVDMVFIVNFIFDFIGIYLTAIVADIHQSKIRYAIASGIYAMVDILVIVFNIEDNGIIFILIYLCVEATNMVICFKGVKIKRYFLLAVLHLGILFTMGGITTCIFNKLEVSKNNMGSVFELIIVGVLVFLLIKYLMPYIIKGIYYRERIYDVTIKLKGKTLTIKGLLDTGNSLRENTTGKRVTIVEKQVLKEFYNVQIDKIFIIPYKSVGKENGVIYGIRVDELIISHAKFEKVAYDAIIGIYDGRLSSDNRYSAILHSECLM